MPTKCARCGGPGDAFVGDGVPYLTRFVHSNPDVCAERFKRRIATLEAKADD